jgi:hypothetical protein
MKKGKLVNWLRKLHEWKAKVKLSSKTTAISQSNVNPVGKKADISETLSNISLYDSCYYCPLAVYIDVVCDDKLDLLIISGNPTQSQLMATAIKLITEFNQLSNESEAKSMTDAAKLYHLNRMIIFCLDACYNLIRAGKYKDAITYLNKNGMSCEEPQNDKERSTLLKTIQHKIKNRMIKYREAETDYKNLTGKQGERPTRKYFNRILVLLSTCEVIKMQLNPRQITVAEFAEYLNIFNEYQNYRNIQKENHRHKL